MTSTAKVWIQLEILRITDLADEVLYNGLHDAMNGQTFSWRAIHRTSRLLGIEHLLYWRWKVPCDIKSQWDKFPPLLVVVGSAIPLPLLSWVAKFGNPGPSKCFLLIWERSHSNMLLIYLQISYSSTKAFKKLQALIFKILGWTAGGGIWYIWEGSG